MHQSSPHRSKSRWIITLLTLCLTLIQSQPLHATPSASESPSPHHRQQPEPQDTLQQLVTTQADLIIALQAQLAAEKAQHQATRQTLETLKKKHELTPAPAPPAPAPSRSYTCSYPQEADDAWIAPQSDLIALSSADGKIISLYRLATGEKIASIQHEGDINHVAFSPDSKLLATASIDNTSKLCHIHARCAIDTFKHDSYICDIAFPSSPKYFLRATTKKLHMLPLP